MAKPKKKVNTGNEVFNSQFLNSLKRLEKTGMKLNPFLQNLKIDTALRDGEKLEAEPVYDKHGRVVDTKHTKVVRFDKSQFVKIYPEMLSNFYLMEKAGKGVLCLFLQEMKSGINQDEVRIRYEENFYFDKSGEKRTIKKSTFYSGVKQLEELGFIAKKEPNVYWINPAYIFNGNRFSFCQSFIDKDAEIEAEQEEKRLKPVEQQEELLAA